MSSSGGMFVTQGLRESSRYVERNTMEAVDACGERAVVLYAFTDVDMCGESKHIGIDTEEENVQEDGYYE